MACLYSFPPGARVVVTMSDSAYGEFVQPWASRMAMLNWTHQVFIALDDAVAQTAQAHVPCVVNYKGIMSTVPKGITSLVGLLPAQAGLGKFDVMGILAEQNIEMALFSEMDVFWIQDPAPMLMAGPPLVTTTDRPWLGDPNIGVIRVKPDGRIARFLKELAIGWNARISDDPSAGKQVGADQGWFHQQVYQRLGNKGPMWNVLDPTIFGDTWGSYDHLKVGQTICVHFIFHGFPQKKILLDKMYTGVPLQGIMDYDRTVAWS